MKSARLFEYVAVGADGEQVAGRRNADDELELDRLLEATGLTLTRAKVVKLGSSTARGKLGAADLMAFTTQVATVLSAGVPLVSGLRDIGGRMRSPAARIVIEEVVKEVESGHALSDALDHQGKSFPDVYRASVRAGELSGSIPEVLRRLAKHLEWARSMRSTTLQALVYPAMLSFAICGLIVTLITFVLPRIVKMFPGGAEDLPTQTRILLGISGFLTDNAVLLVLGVVVLVVGSNALLRRPAIRERVSRLLLRTPKVGEVARMLAVSRFASTAATLYNAGCDVFTVLQVGGEACGNYSMRCSFERVGRHVQRGGTITEGLEAEPDIDPLMIQMTAVGEQTGALGASFDRLTEYYDGEVPRIVKWLLSLLEPTILIVAGAVVAFILLAALMPMFSLYDNLG
ncbi:MAG: hypothetical protein GY711_17395 [bacterium]|nr:hypothetical protein [bacterium]